MLTADGRERVVTVVPIRSFRNGKTRLATVLDQGARESLLRRTAGCVVDAARRSGSVETVVVVSPDADALAWASALGPNVVALMQPAGLPGLNGAIDAGREWALAAGAAALLSLFADLPLLAADDIRSLTARAEPLVLGPDRRGEGTNALLLRLAGNGVAFRFAFGEGSLDRHLGEARRLSLETGVFRATGVAFDLDTPADWADFVTRPRRAADDAPVLLPCGAGIA